MNIEDELRTCGQGGRMSDTTPGFYNQAVGYTPDGEPIYREGRPVFLPHNPVAEDDWRQNWWVDIAGSLRDAASALTDLRDQAREMLVLTHGLAHPQRMLDLCETSELRRLVGRLERLIQEVDERYGND